jgi:hypothetical protein
MRTTCAARLQLSMGATAARDASVDAAPELSRQRLLSIRHEHRLERFFAQNHVARLVADHDCRCVEVR